MTPEPTEEGDRPYPQKFKPRQEWQRRQRNQETLISKPIKSRYSDGFEQALQDADRLTIQQALEDLVQLPSTKVKIKLLQKRQKQLETEIEQVVLSGSSWQGILTLDQSQGINLTFVSPSGSQWRHRITDSESIWDVADYFYGRLSQHFKGEEPVFVGSRDCDIEVQLGRSQPPTQATQMQPKEVKEGDRVRLYRSCLPQTLEWVGDAGLKGEVGESVVFISSVGDGIYQGKTGVITEVRDRDNFIATFLGHIAGCLGDSFTIPVDRSSISRRLKHNELCEDTVFAVAQIHGLGIELFYEGAEFRVASSAIREILDSALVQLLPEPDEIGTPLEPEPSMAPEGEAIAQVSPIDGLVLEQSEITTIIRIGDRVRLQIPNDEVPEHDGREGWVMRELTPQDVGVLIDGFQSEHCTVTCDRAWLRLIEVSPLHIGDVVTVVRCFPKHHTSCIQNLNPKERKLWLESGRGKWIPFDAVKRLDTLKEASVEVKPHLPETTAQTGVMVAETLETILGVVVHVKHASYDVYIGRANSRHGIRGSKWQNSYRIGRDGYRLRQLIQ